MALASTESASADAVVGLALISVLGLFADAVGLGLPSERISVDDRCVSDDFVSTTGTASVAVLDISDVERGSIPPAEIVDGRGTVLKATVGKLPSLGSSDSNDALCHEGDADAGSLKATDGVVGSRTLEDTAWVDSTVLNTTLCAPGSLECVVLCCDGVFEGPSLAPGSPLLGV